MNVSSTPPRNFYKIAKACYEVNKAYCEAIGDNSQPTWKDAQDWQKKSVFNGVEYYYNNPDVKPYDSHNSWLKEKEEDGWKYGHIKDAEKKEHPCLVPYDELPQEQKIKDHLFIAVVRVMLG